MIFLKKEEWKEFWNVARFIIFGAASFVFILGFGIGSTNANDPNYCTYDSLATRMNLGYVAGCELYRPRWRAPSSPCPMKKIFSIRHSDNYTASYNVVTFDDGSTKVMEIDPAMKDKSIQVCQ